MMVAMTAMLVSVAELSNIFSVLAVLICFCAMVLFIMRNMMVFRLHGEELIFGSSVHQVQHQIPQMKMMKVHIPFTFKLTDASKSSYSDLQCLQLYLATGNPLSYEDEPTAPLVCPQEEEERSVWTTAGEQLCVVCQYFPLSRALLPCRHTCICASCFSKLDRCPMCRSPIRSYFCIRGEDYMPSEPCAPATKPPPMLQWLQDLNDRLTDLLGFQR
ncbi:Death-associated inhibitor of apoptosis 1 [Gryllus bimaculatus]|nr:Death-associated inhibitor of apoptosis 1 [Gryllus bimaculatus]